MTCLTALALLWAAPRAALAQSGGGDEAGRAKVVTRLKKARAENRRVTINFKSGAHITGRVGELRAQGLTFEPDGLSPELKRLNSAAIILYEDVGSVQSPSKVRSLFKKVGYGLGMAGGYAVITTLSAPALLLGGSMIPGCP